MENLSMDVLIPVYHPDNKFERLLKALAFQNLPVNKVIIANTEETWWTKHQMDKKLPKDLTIEVFHVKKEEFDHGATRNRLANRSKADLLLFMTQDAVPLTSNLTRYLREGFEQEGTAVVYARQVPAEGCRLIEQFTRNFNYPRKSRSKSKEDLPELGIKTYFCSNVCAAYRRTVFEKLGGFVNRTIFNEDMIFAAKAIQAGYRIYYQASAQVFHSHNYSGMAYLRRNFDLGVSQADFPEVFAKLPAEKEGAKLVGQTAKFLLKNRKPWLLPSLVWLSTCKYVGYRLGKGYQRLPRCLVRRLSMSPNYWKSGKKK
ncbi:MAG: glycosyltransferase family 2 protein [bacterium]|nr:glycosyltransferase family 2 protein [bacterium]